jgi:hypothetical protein
MVQKYPFFLFGIDLILITVPKFEHISESEWEGETSYPRITGKFPLQEPSSTMLPEIASFLGQSNKK